MDFALNEVWTYSRTITAATRCPFCTFCYPNQYFYEHYHACYDRATRAWPSTPSYDCNSPATATFSSTPAYRPDHLLGIPYANTRSICDSTCYSAPSLPPMPRYPWIPRIITRDPILNDDDRDELMDFVRELRNNPSRVGSVNIWPWATAPQGHVSNPIIVDSDTESLADYEDIMDSSLDNEGDSSLSESGTSESDCDWSDWDDVNDIYWGRPTTTSY